MRLPVDDELVYRVSIDSGAERYDYEARIIGVIPT